MDKTITTSDVIGKDPFGRLLAKIRIRPWQAALVSFSFFLVYMFLLPAIYGVLFPRAGLERSSIIDRTNHVGFLIVHPVIIFFFVWQSSAISKLYDLVLPLAPKGVQDKLSRAARITHKGRNWWVIGFLVGSVFVYLGVVNALANLFRIWFTINWLMIVILQVSRLLLFYMIVNIVVRHLVTALNLNRIYREVHLPVLVVRTNLGAAFDGISNYGLSFTGFSAMLGLFLGMRYFYSTPLFPEDAIYLALYFILIPFSFFLPFWQAHVKMRAAREEALDRISESLQAEYDRSMSGFDGDSNKQISSERLVHLRELLLITQQAPTWPFETSSIYRLFGTAVLPFVLPALGYLGDILSLIR